MGPGGQSQVRTMKGSAMRVTMTLWVLFIGLLLSIYVGLSHAQQATQKVPCEVTLAEKTIQAKNLDDHRDSVEQKVAQLQAQLYFANQRSKQLEEKLKALEPKPEEKKSE